LHITPAHVKFSAFETKEEVPIIRAEISDSPNNQAKKGKKKKKKTGVRTSQDVSES